MAKKIVFITPHYVNQKRRTGFYWLADGYHQLGWEVLFFTAPFSFISILNRDNRLQYGLWKNRNKWTEYKPSFFSYIHFSWLHKVDLSQSPLKKLGQWLNPLLSWLVDRTPLSFGASHAFIASADIIVYESAPPLEWAKHIRKINPNAQFVYRVSDDLDILRVHQDTKAFERNNLHLFNYISCPCQAIYAKLQRFNQQACIYLDYHGINKIYFSQKTVNPFANSQYKKHAVFVGISHIDYHFLRYAPTVFPDWSFHYIGPLEENISSENVTLHGEIPFEETIPFIQHAHIGLQACQYAPGAETLTDSLKVLQYTHCGLAIIAPDFLQTSRPNTFYYQQGSEVSIQKALQQAETYSKEQDTTDYQIQSWEELAKKITKCLDTQYQQ